MTKKPKKPASTFLVTLYQEDDRAIEAIRASIDGLPEERWQSEVARHAISRADRAPTVSERHECEAVGTHPRTVCLMVHSLRDKLDEFRTKHGFNSAAAAMRFCLRAVAKAKNGKVK